MRLDEKTTEMINQILANMFRQENGYYGKRVQKNGKRKKESYETKDFEDALYEHLEWRRDVAGKNTHFESTYSHDQAQMQYSMNTPYLTRKSITEAFNEYLETKGLENLSQYTMNQKKKLGVLMKNNRDWTYLDHFTQDTINKFTEKLRDESSDSTVNKIIQELTYFIKYCRDLNYFNPPRFRFFHHKDTPRQVIYTDDEIKRIFSLELKENDYDFFMYLLTLFLTGSRPSEIVFLKRENVDLENNRIHVFQNKTKRWKKIPILSELRQELVAYFKISGYKEFLFKGHRYNIEYYQKKFKKLKKKIGITGKQKDRYTFRHTLATMITKYTNDPNVAKTILDHKEMDFTLYNYVKYDNGILEEKLSPLTDILRSDEEEDKDEE